jgi:hypothetical protein
MDKCRLKKNYCILKYLIVSEDTLLFKFKFGAISMIINVLNRKLDWIKEILEQDEKARLYPEHFRDKIVKIK